eukprot:gene48654-65248_t
MNIAIDLRLVQTTTQEVVDVISYQKQIIGREVSAGVFDFLNGNVFDVSAGTGGMEPVQLAVRALIERATLEMMANLYGAPGPEVCLDAANDPLNTVGATGGYYAAYDNTGTNNGQTRADPSRWHDRRDGDQLQLGDVIAGQTLNVEDATGEVGVNNAAQGNSLSGSVENDALDLTSTQTMRGNTRATTTLTLTGDTEGPVNATTQARGNYLAAGAYGADLTIESTQTVDPSEVTASSTITGSSARLIGGASVGVTAIANSTAIGASGSHVEGT